MTEAIFNSTTLIKFTEDERAFGKCVDEYFKILDSDKDGLISRTELRQGLNKIVSLESEVQPTEEINDVYKAIFERFDEDGNGSIDWNEFNALMREMMLAMARAFGGLPVYMFLHRDGWLMKAVQHELKNGKKGD